MRNFLEYTGSPTSSVNGYVPRIIAPEGFWSLPEMCKPFLAQMTYLASESMGNYWWVRPLYDRLARTLYFWENAGARRTACSCGSTATRAASTTRRRSRGSRPR